MREKSRYNTVYGSLEGKLGEKEHMQNDENYWQHFDEPHFLCHSS